MASARYGRAGRGRRTRPGLNSQINITPLVDVMLVLLIVFILTAQFLSVGIPLELPKTDAQAMRAEQDELTISVRKDGVIFLQESEVSLEDLKTRLVAMAANGYAERINIRGDKDGDYGPVMKVMATINAAGFTNIGLVTDPITP
ncbi:MAG: biopolymer transporter ExbD [Robiginitomaculum sp.]|nr:biopolymer transporter ExbD [Robiginitomaculum sp.]